MLLKQISSKDPLTKIVIDGLAKTAPVLFDAEFYAKGGSADNVKKAGTSTISGIFRSLNENNSSTPPDPVYEPHSKKIISFDTKVDVMLEDRNEDPEKELAVQTRLDAEEAGFLLQEKFFEGQSSQDAEEFDGLREITPEDNLKYVAANGLILPLGSSDSKITAQQQAIEELLKLFATVRGGATHAYMNEYLKIRLLSIAKNLGYYRMEKDKLGSTIEKIGSVIIRGGGYKSDGTPLLPFNETVGTATSKCSSIFAVRWGERVDLTALTSVGVKARYSGQSGNFLVNNINLDMALVLQNDSAIVQSSGWRLD